MCGINGIISRSAHDDLTKRVQLMNDAIEHRGKDSSGITALTNGALGHRRLSIIDLNPTGHQPMTSNSGKWSITFNGEIYNHSHIRKLLPDYSFKGTSDSEVLLAAIETKGIDWFLKTANGMFAFAAFEHDSEQILLARDRVGIKPLYYYHDENHLIFSSEIKGILHSGLVEPQFNVRAIDDYLGYRYVREPNTFFQEIKQVRSGHYLQFDGPNKTKEAKYWEVPTTWNTSTAYDEKDIRDEFENQILRAVRLRLMSEVPLGCYLSGGVDSSLLTALAQSTTTERLNTYNIGFKNLNEFQYARTVARQYNTQHHELTIQEDAYFQEWEDLIRFKDAPLAVPNEIPLSTMSSTLKENISVVLSGEGADELMGGYGRIFRSYFDFTNHDPKNNFYEYFIAKYEYVSRDVRDKFLREPQGYRREYDESISTDFLRFSGEHAIFRFFHSYHVKGLLQRVDMSTMQTTVEARVPFLDHELIEFAYSKIPFELKMKWHDSESKLAARKMTSSEYSEILDTPKYLLREVARKYLPKDIIDRKKIGFPVPLNDWMTRLGEIAHDELNGAKWLSGNIDNLIQRSKTEARAGQVLWMFINIEKFRKLYFERTWKW